MDNRKIYAYISAGLSAASAVFLGLSFTVLAIYALIASIVLSISALSFANIQKKKNPFPALLYFRIAAYIMFGLSIAVFVGGIIWANL